VDAACGAAGAEVTTPEHDGLTRDRVRKRRSYAQAGIPVYVLIDDYDGHGTVSILTSPSPGEGVYAAKTCVPYGTEVVIPEGPAKGFVIDESITGPLRDRMALHTGAAGEPGHPVHGVVRSRHEPVQRHGEVEQDLALGLLRFNVEHLKLLL
jgi:hypothetical protein